MAYLYETEYRRQQTEKLYASLVLQYWNNGRMECCDILKKGFDSFHHQLFHRPNIPF